MSKDPKETPRDRTPPKLVRLTKENIACWPSFQKLLDDGKILFDAKGRLRYRHGAPVWDLILARINKDGRAIYKELAEEWFDPDSPKAERFEWPK